MKRIELEDYIKNNYNAEPDFPWSRYPSYGVFRHKNNKKWFALIMNISKNKLGLQGNDCVDAVNLKCSPMMIGTLIDGENIFPAYHMSKANWITVVLDENIEEDKIKSRLHISLEMTAVKIKSKRI